MGSQMKPSILRWAVVCLTSACTPGAALEDTAPSGESAETEDTLDTDTADTYDEGETADTQDPNEISDGIAVLARYAKVNGDGVTATSAQYGDLALEYDVRANDWDIHGEPLCYGYTKLVQTNEDMPDCPACEFTYSFVGVSGGSSHGAACVAIEDAAGPLSNHAIGSEIGLGYSSTYVGEDGGYDLPTAYVFLRDYEEYGWILFAVDDAPYYSVDGNGEGAFEFRDIRKDYFDGLPLDFEF